MYKTIKLRIHNPECDPRQDSFKNGNWTDLASAENVWFNAPKIIINSEGEQSIEFDYQVIPLGISMTLPKWYKAEIKPRSSMYKYFGIIQTNSVGEIEADFSQQYMLPALAFKKSHITKGERICQFQIKLREDAPWYMKIADLFRSGFNYKEVNVITTTRGGYGHTGTGNILGVTKL